ncbi:MAG: TonB-dependent receptor domain-containing protein [Candidatus Saccharibacteria bacterium]
MKRSKSHCLFLLILLILCSGLWVQAQEPVFSLHARDKRLGALLEEISKDQACKFAYDADYFSTISTNIDLDNSTIGQFLAVLCKQHSLGYKLIDGTYVLFRVAPKEEKILTKTRVEGKVSDINTNEALAYSYIIHPTAGTITNELGHFSLQDNSGKAFAISISHLGYHRLDTLIQPGYKGFLNLRLRPFAMELAQVNIKAREKNVLEMAPQSDAIAFNPRQTANIPRVDENDMVNALTLIPGINFLGGSYSGLSIRGGSPSENLITIDGIPVLETNHLFGNVSALNSKFIKQAFVSRGGYDVSKGDRVSGIVELIGKTGKRSNPEADLSANLINGNGFGAIPLGKKVSLSGAYNQSYVDRWPNYLFDRLQSISPESSIGSAEGQGTSLTPMVRYRDANAKLSVRPTEKQEISINGLLSDESMKKDFVFDNERSFKGEKAEGNSHGASANYSLQYKGWLNKFSASYTQLERSSFMEAGRTANVNNGNKKKKPAKGARYEMESDQNHVEEKKIAWQSEVTHSIFEHKFGAGVVDDEVSYRFEAQKSSGNIPVDSLDDKRQSTIYNVYYQQQITPWKPLKVRAGIRADYSTQNRQVIYQPRAGIYLSPLQTLEFYYLTGKYAQYLSQIRKTDIYGNFALAWYLPDQTGHGLLQSVHHVAGSKFEKGKILVNLEFYQKTTDGKMNLFATLYKKANVTRIDYKAYTGDEISRGMDLFVQYQDNQWTQMLAYTLSNSRERYEGYNGGAYFPSFNDQRHRLRLVEMYHLKSWIGSASWVYNTGFPTPVSAVGEQAIQFSRLNDFSQLDLGLVKRFRYRHIALDMGGSLLNVLNRKNVLEKDYFSITDAAGTSTLKSEITGISFTPVFYLNLRIGI